MPEKSLPGDLEKRNGLRISDLDWPVMYPFIILFPTICSGNYGPVKYLLQEKNKTI